jgi:hypothetical protein
MKTKRIVEDMEYIIHAEWEDQNVKPRWRTDKLQVMAIDHRTHWSQMSYKEINPPLHQELIFYMMKTQKKNHFEILIFIVFYNSKITYISSSALLQQSNWNRKDRVLWSIAIT